MTPVAALPNVQEQGGISDPMAQATAIYSKIGIQPSRVFAAYRSLCVSVNHLGSRGTPSYDRSPNLPQTRVTLLDYILRLTLDRHLVCYAYTPYVLAMIHRV